MRRMRIVASSIADFRYAFRRIVKAPMASVAAVLALACGISAAAGTWNLLSSLLITPLPMVATNELFEISIERVVPPRLVFDSGHAYRAYEAVRDSGVFSEVAVSGVRPVRLGADQNDAAVDAAFVSTGFFTTLGVTPQAGRDFAEVDDHRGRSPVVILSDGFWRRSLGTDPAVLGREVAVSGLQVSVIGIAPAHFRGLRLGRPVDLFFPLESARELVEGGENLFAAPNTGYSPLNWLILTGRLDGVTPGAAVARLDGILEEVRGDNGRWLLTDVQTAAIPRAARPGVSRFMSLLGWTVALLLLTGSLGVGTLLRIRTESRRREFGIRLALGAPRLRLVGDVAAEAFILAAAGSVLALPLAVWELSLIRVFELPGRIAIESLSLPEAGSLLPSVGALGAVATVVITVAGAAFGLAAQPSVMRRLQGSRDMPGSRARTALVATQVAITLVLLTGTGLFLRSVTAALALNPGYGAANLASGAISLPEGYSEAGADALFRTIRDRMEASPAITSASVTSRRGAMSSGGELIVNGIGRRFPTAVWFTVVDEFYFPTIGLEVIGGRNFTGSDAGGRPVAIVSESLARALGPDRARGSRIAAFYTTAEGDRPEFEVVGVVPDLITDVAVLEPLTLYLPSSQRAGAANRELVFRSAADLAIAVEEATAIVRSEDSDIRLRPFRSLEQRISEQMGAQRFGVSVMSGLGVITVVLTGVGIYVLTELIVARRRQELAIRAALGAGAWALAMGIIREIVRPLGLGAASGLAIVWIGQDLIRSFLFQVQPLDIWTLLSGAAVLGLLAVVVSLRPLAAAVMPDLGRMLKED